MKFTSSKIHKAFGHKLIGSKFMKKIVCETVSIFSEEIIQKVTSKCWVVSSFEDGWAFVLRGDELKKDESLIFLSDELLKENEKQIKYTIAHEVAHVILGHRNSIGKPQTKSEVAKQEKEADEFAIYFLAHD